MNGMAGKRVNTLMEQVFTLVDLGFQAVPGRLCGIGLYRTVQRRATAKSNQTTLVQP